MDRSDKNASDVAGSLANALGNDALRQGVLQFGDTQILFSKSRRLAETVEPLTEPTDYPDVPSSLKDDNDSWLK